MQSIIPVMSVKEYRPTLAQLRTFVTIAENRHFGAAAAKLGISQPSLSQALVALETGLGLQLIERSTRRVIVTSAGEALLPYAKSTLEAAEAFMQQSRGASGSLTGQLSIGIIPTVAPFILPELLSITNERYPDLRPQIVEEQTRYLIQQLRDGQLDVFVAAVPTDAPGLVQAELYTENFVVVTPAGHPLGGREDLTLTDLGDLDLLLLDDGHCLRDQVLDLCHQADLNPLNNSNAVTRASSLTTIIQLVNGGLGSTLVPESAVKAECIRPGLSISHFAPGTTASRNIGLIHRASSSRAAEFAEFGQIVSEAYARTARG